MKIVSLVTACALLTSVAACEVRTRPETTVVREGRTCGRGEHLDRDHDSCVRDRDDHDHDHDHDRHD